MILATFRDAAKKVIGRSKKQRKSNREGRVEYNAKDNEVKRSARQDKRNWKEKRAAAAETAAQNDKNKELFSTSKTIARESWGRRQEVGVKDKQRLEKRGRDGKSTLVKN